MEGLGGLDDRLDLAGDEYGDAGVSERPIVGTDEATDNQLVTTVTEANQEKI